MKSERLKLCIRNFIEDDIPVLREKRYSEKAGDDYLRKLITQWNTKEYGGKYFEMFAVVSEDGIVGTVSLYEHSKSVVSYGIEIFEEYRMQGYGYQAVLKSFAVAKDNGYKILTAQVRIDNSASLALCQKVGMEKQHEYVNAKGNKVSFWIKLLV